MRTTIRLNESLLRQVKLRALEQRKTFTAVVEDALAAWLQREPAAGGARKRIRIPKSGKGGVLPGVDLDNSASLSDRMEGLS